MSNLTALEYVANPSQLTTGLFNQRLSVISANFAALNSDVTIGVGSGDTVSIQTNLETIGGAHFQFLSIGSTPPSYVTTAAITVEVNSASSDYLYMIDASGQKSSYVIGSRAGGLADGLNIWDASAGTLIASFSKQSVRFFQNVVGPVFDVGGALADTLNAATFGTGADSIESRIQAAISAATIAGITRVYVPANMYPYSGASVSHDTRVQMVREGGDWTVFDIIAYGANGNGSSGSGVANQAAIQSAVSAANWDPGKHGIRGGTVYIPTGQYSVSGQITVPMAVNQGQVILRGANMRASILAPTQSGGTFILFGSPVQDPAVSLNSITQFCAVQDLEITGTQAGANTCAMQWTEMQKGWIQNVLITGFQASGCIGLYLLGSNSGGPEHSWRGGFYNLVIASTYRPLVMQNADENDFFNCNFGLPIGLTSAVTAIQLLQGNSNRFFGTTLSGEVSSLTTGRPNYTGVALSATTGNTSNNQFYGLWVEGFDSGVSVSSGVSNNTFYNANPAICRQSISDAGQSTVWIETANLAVPLYQYPDGTPAGPSYAFHSEGSLGWYKSATSTIGVSPTGRLVVGSGQAFSRTTEPEYGFGGEPMLGMLRSAASRIAFYAGGVRLGQFSGSNGVGAFYAETGSNTSPSITFQGEPRLGFYTSAVSTLALSYGTFNLAAQANFMSLPLTGSATNPTVKWGNNADGLNYQGTNGFWDSIASAAVCLRFGPRQVRINELGSAVTPGYAFVSEISLGLYRSGVSTIAASYGTLNLATQAVRLSMRTLAASSVTPSAVNTNVARDEVVFTIGGASGASLIISSGGTAYIFNSAASAILA
jgi:hypothetical protein